ncbi:SRPBCC family protein [Hoeflea prorocentri]|uniref:SRPBCC domain-containing protein n=1 Tax=Hoeflea prorocentri TaxID=1922333 RepID=A0A9X3UEZ6_9HYPH|nr:SRPBCC domain-containing protein [Hoeflea prorocentri]MCY6380072.1 SRPBCC domain-containing protein [Hoeflea prorocentri]MDA5397872.1 SRPBCC domain-containing protein [Hoeflea prorocentri]
MGDVPEDNYRVHESMWFNTDRETAFAGWTEPEAIASWFGPPGYKAEVLELDLVTGGRWRFRMVPEAGWPSHHAGRYVEIVRPGRLVFTWESEEDLHLTNGRETLVTVTFAEEAGGVRIDIIHERLPDRSAKEALSYGWRSGIERLEDWLRRLET